MSRAIHAIAAAIVALAITSAADARPKVYQNTPRTSKSACERYAFPVQREIEWFEQISLKLDSGAKRPALPERAFTLALEADGTASLVMPPERKSRQDNGYAGAVSFDTVPGAGLYQISLSEDGLIDVIQDGKYLRKIGSTTRRDCSGVRRVLRVELAAGPVTLQLGGVEYPNVNVAIAPAGSAVKGASNSPQPVLHSPHERLRHQAKSARPKAHRARHRR